MCGIAGLFDVSRRPVDILVLERMKRALLHRGPDNSDIESIDNIGLVHTRLSVLDLSNASNQPMWDENRRACISYNGEIYNFREIRRELEQLGVRFQSTGDTEVLLKACIEFGVDKTLPRLNGMFAFAYWDFRTKELWIARDRMGIKPLYVTKTGDQIAFASEIKALCTVIGTPTADVPVLYHILAGSSAWEPYTLFSNIFAVKPGHYLRISLGNPSLKQHCYFDLCDVVNKDKYNLLNKMPVESVVDRLRQHLDQSVELHSISDAPVAVMVSGGIDSALIAALSKKVCPGISLYHSDVQGPNSELEYARQVANYLNAPLVVSTMGASEYVGGLAETTYFHETPSAYHPNDVPFQLVAKRAHEDGIKVFLTGEGADELFLGYGAMTEDIIRHKLKKTVNGLISALGSRSDRVRRLIQWGAPDFGLIAGLGSRGTIFEFEEKANDTYSFVQNKIERRAMVNGVIYLKMHLNSLLQRNDRMGMMHGLESRIPFLENNIVRFALNLPVRYKHHTTWFNLLRKRSLANNKMVLRGAAAGLVPESIAKRKKVGFPVTPHDYLQIDTNIFKGGFLEETLGIGHLGIMRHLSVADAQSKWRFFATEIFGRMFFQGEPVADLTEKIKKLSRCHVVN